MANATTPRDRAGATSSAAAATDIATVVWPLGSVLPLMPSVAMPRSGRCRTVYFSSWVDTLLPTTVPTATSASASRRRSSATPPATRPAAASAPVETTSSTVCTGSMMRLRPIWAPSKAALSTS